MEIHLERGSNRCWFEQTSIWLDVEAPIRTRVDRTSIWKGKKEDILSRRQIQEKIFYRKFKFWPRVILPNFELENSKFDLSLFTSLQRQTPKGICTRQMYKINKNKQNCFPDSIFIYETLNQKDEGTWHKNFDQEKSRKSRKFRETSIEIARFHCTIVSRDIEKLKIRKFEMTPGWDILNYSNWTRIIMYIIRVTRFESTEIILEPDILSLVPLHSSKYKTV